MIFRALALSVSILVVTACGTADVYHFVHEETEADRRGLQWSNPAPNLASQIEGDELPYMVIDFYSFWPGYSAEAYVYVVQQDKSAIELKSISVTSSKTGESHHSALNVEASPKMLGNGLYLYRYRVLDTRSTDKFSKATSLDVNLVWISPSQREETTTFNLKKHERTEVVWPT